MFLGIRGDRYGRSVDGFPVLMHTALDVTRHRGLAELYRVLLGLLPAGRRAADRGSLGVTVVYHRAADREEPLYVLADPAGHPFCLLVG